MLRKLFNKIDFILNNKNLINNEENHDKDYLSNFQKLRIKKNNDNLNNSKQKSNFGLYTDIEKLSENSDNSKEPLEETFNISKDDNKLSEHNLNPHEKRHSVEISRDEFENNALLHSRAKTKMMKKDQNKPFEPEFINPLNLNNNKEESFEEYNMIPKIEISPYKSDSLGLGQVISQFLENLRVQLIDQVRANLLNENKNSMNSIQNFKFVYSQKYENLETLFNQSI
jgi:ribosomal protein L30E